MIFDLQEGPWRTALRDTTREPMFFLLAACALAYLLLGNRLEALLLLLFVLLLGLMAAWQSIRTGRALQALRDLQVPMARIRTVQGPRLIRALELKTGDVLVLSPGDRVAADARLLDGYLAMDESLLTGESTRVSKAPGVDVVNWELGIAQGPHDESNRVFAGTYVMTGQAHARVEQVGELTRLGQLGASVDRTVRRPSRLALSAQRLVRRVGILALVLAVLQLAVSYWLRGEDLLHALLESLTLAMATLPEEIPVIMTVFMAMGAWRMSRSRVLTRRLSAIEVLGSVTCIAIDKTGTLTENRMQLVAAQTQGMLYGSAELAPFALAAQVASERPERTGGLLSPADLTDLMQAARLAVAPHSADPIDQCLRGASTPLPAKGLIQLDMSAEWPVQGMAFAGDHGEIALACKGAPECVLDLCPFSAEQRREWSGRLEAMAARGWRVLAVARGSAPSIGALCKESDPWIAARQVARWTLVGLIAFYDPPRGSVRSAVKTLQSAGVRLLMLTGDHPVTALAIAQAVGLSRHRSVLTGMQIAQLSDEMLIMQLRTTDVCARMTAQQKLRVIACLQHDGQIVAMTGDGVNDAPALKAADVGVAMGRRACDLARETADIVLLDDDFGHMVSAIAQGRSIFRKMSRTTAFVVAAHVPMLVLVLVPGFLNWPVLLMPAHVVLFEMLINPACSVVFDAQSHDRAGLLESALPAGSTPFESDTVLRGAAQGLVLTVFMLLGLAFIWLKGLDDVQQRTFVFLLLVIFVLEIGLFKAGTTPELKPSGAWWGFAGVIVLLVFSSLSVPTFSALLALAWPAKTTVGALAMAAVAAALYLGAGRLMSGRTAQITSR